MWSGDVLERKKDADFLTKYLTGLYESSPKKNFILNINSSWGFGKTFFLSEWKKELEKNYPVIYYDAWVNDFSSEPLVSFISTIEDQISVFLKGRQKKKVLAGFKDVSGKIIKSAAPLAAAIIIKKLTGMSAEEFELQASESDLDDLGDFSLKAAEEALSSYKEKAESIVGFKQKLAEIVKAIDAKQSLRPPVFVFVDELDRCKPTFAINLLEAIKHLFNVEGFYFVIATNSEQLAHSISAVYGAGFDSPKYLKRFFDREYSFSKPNYFSFVKLLEVTYSDTKNLFFPMIKGDDHKAIMISKVFAFFNLGLRDMDQCFAQLQACSLTAENGVSYDGTFLTYLICLKHLYPDRFDKEINGEDESFDHHHESPLVL